MQANDLAKVGHALDVSIATARPELATDERLSLVRGVATGVSSRSPAFLEALAEAPRDHWIDPARGTLAWHLRASDRHLRVGRVEKAIGEFQLAEKLLSTGTSLECADYWYLTGRTESMQGRTTASTAAYWKAAQINSQPKFWKAWAESELRHRHEIDGANDFSDVIEQLHGMDPMILSIKARLIAAEGKYDQAISLLDSFSGAESLSERVVIQTMFSKPADALQTCNVGLALTGINDSTRQLFL